MAEFNDVYSRAVLYDIVFNRDVSGEIDFIDAVSEKHRGSAPTALLDLACGPGYHARAFARRGGRAVGLDLRPEMLAFAAEQAAAEGAQVEWIAADMRCVRLKEPVDMAINVFDGIDCLLSNDDLIAHMQAIANCLTPRGLYLIDVTHPRLTNFNSYEQFHYAGQRDSIEVRIDWATNGPRLDPVRGVFDTEIRMHVRDNGTVFEHVDSACERILTANEIDLLARVSGQLRVVDWYGAYDINRPLDNTPQSPRMIAILQKIN
ncbi:MAG: class I SAM-dependent methyltransferase [Chloroflexota bacterium]